MKYLKILMFASVLPVIASAQVDTNSQHFYMFVYFLNAEQSVGARLAFSSDAVNWQKYNDEKPIFTPQLSSEALMRDPNTCYDARTGVFHLVWTTGWNQKNVGYATSTDLIHWTPQTEIPVGTKIPGCQLCWAPEIYRDAGVSDSFMVFWSTDNGTNGKRTWYSMTKDFKNFTAPIKFFDPGYSVIDATVLKVDAGKYYMFFKDERDPAQAGTQAQNVHYIYGPTPHGPWSSISKWITTPGCEGPTAIQIGNEYRVYFDPFLVFSNTYRMVKVTDLTTTASPWPQGDILKTATGNFLYNHGSISEIPRAKVMQILYGVPDTTTYQPWTVATADQMVVADPVVDINALPIGKRNTGCGTGVGLALLPPIFFKIAARRRRKKQG